MKVCIHYKAGEQTERESVIKHELICDEGQ